MENKTHVFEKAGLGKAPYTFVGNFSAVGPYITIKDGIQIEIGAKGQPMESCDYCGTGIGDVYQIRSADGKTFNVGSSCIAKAGDDGLKANVNEIKRKRNIEKQDAKIAENWQWYLENKSALQLLPYGKHDLASSIEWFYKNAGRAGKLRIIKDAKAALKSIESESL